MNLENYTTETQPLGPADLAVDNLLRKLQQERLNKAVLQNTLQAMRLELFVLQQRDRGLSKWRRWLLRLIRG